jgi:hypothetical protein
MASLGSIFDVVAAWPPIFLRDMGTSFARVSLERFIDARRADE